MHQLHTTVYWNPFTKRCTNYLTQNLKRWYFFFTLRLTLHKEQIFQNSVDNNDICIIWPNKEVPRVLNPSIPRPFYFPHNLAGILDPELHLLRLSQDPKNFSKLLQRQRESWTHFLFSHITWRSFKTILMFKISAFLNVMVCGTDPKLKKTYDEKKQFKWTPLLETVYLLSYMLCSRISFLYACITESPLSAHAKVDAWISLLMWFSLCYTVPVSTCTFNYQIMRCSTANCPVSYLISYAPCYGKFTYPICFSLCQKNFLILSVLC